MRIAAALLFIVMSFPVQADNGLVIRQSAFGPAETLDRLQAVLDKKGLTIFARVDHAAGASKAGLALRPTQLLIFGNPKMGTPLMNSKQSVGIDLPMKVLAWEDDQGQSWVAYNRPDYLASRHGITDRPEIIEKMTGALDALTNKAIQPDS